MPSPGSRGAARRAGEWVLRAAALLLLALAVARALRPPAARPAAAVTLDSGDAARRAAAWAAGGVPDSVRVALDSAPAPAARALLRAARRAGARVAWRGDSLVPLAVHASPVAHPRGGTRVAAAAPAGRLLSLGDAGGLLDSARSAGGGAALVARGPLAGVTASLRGTARAAAPAGAAVRRVLVLGAAGWEAKFAVAALEEDGWAVEARLRVAPGVVVAQGAAGAPDTARHSAVVVVDSLGAAEAAPVARYVRAGGGLVLAGPGGASAGLAAVAPGRLGALLLGAPGALAGPAPRAGLAMRPLVALDSAAAVIAREPRGAAAAARRAGLGRVVLAGYADSWRWRMEGGADAPAAHRAWWSVLVSGVAYAPDSAGERRPPGAGRGDPAAELPAAELPAADPAPYAALVEALGPPTPLGPASSSLAARRSALDAPWPLFLTILALLLAEWASRRARGSR